MSMNLSIHPSIKFNIHSQNFLKIDYNLTSSPHAKCCDKLSTPVESSSTITVLRRRSSKSEMRAKSMRISALGGGSVPLAGGLSGCWRASKCVGRRRRRRSTCLNRNRKQRGCLSLFRVHPSRLYD